KVLDQIVRDGLDLTLRNGNIEVEHHAHHRAPPFRRIAGARAVDVMAAAADLHERLLAGTIRETRLRLLRMRAGRGADECGCEHRQGMRWVCHAFSPHLAIVQNRYVARVSERNPGTIAMPAPDLLRFIGL